MVTAGWIPASNETRDTIKSSLVYFDVADPEEWRERYTEFQNSFRFRASPTSETKLGALAAWLRQAEIRASAMNCEAWNAAALRERLGEMRRLTKATNLDYFIPRLRALCAEVGIAFVFLRAPAGARERRDPVCVADKGDDRSELPLPF